MAIIHLSKPCYITDTLFQNRRDNDLISFERFQKEDGVPVYLQIIFYIKRGIASGAIVDGDTLPSRRVVSALLGVNPNTVQKAYRILEEESLIQSRSGAKSCMVLDQDVMKRIRRELVENDTRTIVNALRQMGLDRAEVHCLIDRLWEEEI